MATGAIYSTVTGLIQATINPPLSDAAQLEGLKAVGQAQVIIPDGKDGSSGMINLAAGQYIDYAPPPPPKPSLHEQTAAALINAGVIPVTAYHPATIAELNASLTAANMNTVTPATPADDKP